MGSKLHFSMHIVPIQTNQSRGRWSRYAEAMEFLQDFTNSSVIAFCFFGLQSVEYLFFSIYSQFTFGFRRMQTKCLFIYMKHWNIISCEINGAKVQLSITVKWCHDFCRTSKMKTLQQSPRNCIHLFCVVI